MNKRNPIAKDVRTLKFRMRVVPNKKRNNHITKKLIAQLVKNNILL